MASIDGEVEAGFEAVRKAFELNFERHDELGASFCAYVDGHPVVDLWDKEAIPVRWRLSHQAGVVAVDEPISLEDIIAWDPVIEKIERQAPCWTPGQGVGYHASTYGWLVGELVRRVTGRTIGTFLAEEIAAPLGMQAWLGLPDEQLANLARLKQSWSAESKPDPTDAPATLMARVFANPGVIDPDDLRNLKAERPAGGCVTNGRGLARPACRASRATSLSAAASPSVEAVAAVGAAHRVLEDAPSGLAVALEARERVDGAGRSGGVLRRGDVEDETVDDERPLPLAV